MIATAELRAYVGANASEDGILTEMEQRAVKWFERRTRQYFSEPKSVEQVLKGSDTNILWLKWRPNRITSVIYRSYPGSDEVVVLESDENGFEIREEDSRLYRKGGTDWSSDYEWVVVYEIGYGDNYDGVPADVRAAILELVRLAYNIRKTKGATQVVSESLGDYQYTLASSAEAKAVDFVWSTVHAWERRLI